MAASPDFLDKRFGTHPFDGIFSRRVDRNNADQIGIVETGCEIVEKIAQPGISVRLCNGDHASLAGVARSPKHGPDLDRMMAIVVEDLHPFPGPGMGEAPLHAAE